MLKKACSLTLCGVLSFSVAGCGTLALGTSQLVRVESQPGGARVAINGQLLGETPTTLRLSTSTAHIMQVSMEGYQPQVIQLNKTFNNWTWVNVLWLFAGLVPGIVGFAVDAGTGGMYRLTPSQVNVAFDQMGSKTPARSQDGDVAIFIVLQSDPSWEKVGQLEPIAAR